MTTRRNLLAGGAVLVVAGAGASFSVARNMGSLDHYRAAVALMRVPTGRDPDLASLLRYATLAPSGHNAQPWKFSVSPGRIDILPDLTRRTPVVDPDDHHLFVSLGCAAENLSLASSGQGLPGEIRYDPSGFGSAVFDFVAGTPKPSPLVEAITRRQSTRSDYDGKPVSNGILDQLSRAAATAGVEMALITDRPRIDQIRDLVIEGNKTQMSDQAFLEELRSWMRFSPRRALQTGDGLFSATTGNPVMPEWLGPTVFDLAFKTSSENAKYARQIASSAGLAVFVAESENPEGWIQVGRAAQRCALQATALGLKCAFINQALEVPRLRPELASLMGIPGRRADLVMRFGHGPDLPFSARRPVSEVQVQS